MIPSDAGGWSVAAAIAAMAVATYAMRAGGFWLMGHLPPSLRLRRMLEAWPGKRRNEAIAPYGPRSTAAAAGVAARLGYR
jgi:uncharacterized membrane protein